LKPPPAESQTSDQAVETIAEPVTITMPDESSIRPTGQLPFDRGTFFAGSGNCATCHTRLTDNSGQDVSNDRLWRSTMMANSARDPYWEATVRAETILNPELQDVIEHKCATCHMPMAWFTISQDDKSAVILGENLRSDGNDLQPFALDGVSCTVCHQIQAEGLGDPDSFSGGFLIDSDASSVQRLAYGPYTIPPGQAQVMTAGSGFLPLFGAHSGESELCATCHNLTTDSIDHSGNVIGQFHEQMVHLEWQHSSYRHSSTCQDCHMPQANGSVQISITGSPPRQPFFQHNFVGGNVYMSKILDVFADDLAVSAGSEHFQNTRDLTLDQLQNRTTTVRIENISLDHGILSSDVAISSLVGHKLPSGFPSRRVWLNLVVEDAAGNVIFNSGQAAPDGSILGNDNDENPDLYEPHYQVIDQPDQVQIYEVIFKDSSGNITTSLMRANEYLKDNRLIPAGFDKQTAVPEIGVYGAALEDENFTGGEDRLQYRVSVGDAVGPFTVSIQVLYQSIGFRWMENLRQFDAPETTRMAVYYDTIPNLPVILAAASGQAGD
jgi:hypothetical protein